MICHQCEVTTKQIQVEFLDSPNQGQHVVIDLGVVPFCFRYTRFQCYVHRRHLGSSFDMLSNLAEIKMLPQRTLLRSSSTFSDKMWIY